METINEYLKRILADFLAYLAEGHSLCALRDVNYNASNIPDYGDVHSQQYYLLKYAYGYAFEYKRMYELLFAKFPPRASLHVTSIGCGAMLDYWALQAALEPLPNAVPVDYTGIDLVNWNYRVPRRRCDHALFIQDSALRVLQNQLDLAEDIFFFPKSISEFTNEEFFELCHLFQEKLSPALGRLHVLITLRLDRYSRSRDDERTALLIASIRQNGFELVADDEVAFDPEERETPLYRLDPGFCHPRSVIDTLTSLYERCANFTSGCPYDPQQCSTKCLNRYPILKATQICNRILTFDRMGGPR